MDEELDQLASDFAVNYLAKKGVAEEDILDENGQLDPEVRDHIISLMDQGGDRSAFLAEYKADPEGKLKSVIDAEDEVQSAKKGAKLKTLNKLKQYKKGAPMTKKKKCSCGCAMIDKKEEGGKVVSKCACGCKGVVKAAEGIKTSILQVPGAVVNPAVLDAINKPIYHGRPGAVVNPNLFKLPEVFRIPGAVLNPALEGHVTKSQETAILPSKQTVSSALPSTPNFIYPAPPMGQHDSPLNYPGGSLGSYRSRLIPEPVVPQAPQNVPNTANKKITSAPESKMLANAKPAGNKLDPTVSIVDYLKTQGVTGKAASLPERKKLAESLGMKGYTGKGNQNADLINILRNNKLKETMLAHLNNPNSFSDIEPPLQKTIAMNQKGGAVDKKENYIAALAKKKQAPKVVKKTKK